MGPAIFFLTMITSGQASPKTVPSTAGHAGTVTEQVGKKRGSECPGQRVLDSPELGLPASAPAAGTDPTDRVPEHSRGVGSGCGESEMQGGWLLAPRLSGHLSGLCAHRIVSIHTLVNVHVSLASGSRSNQVEGPVEGDPPLCGL